VVERRRAEERREALVRERQLLAVADDELGCAGVGGKVLRTLDHLR
jgi:hypothetical protein